jgi:hypothetical protein
MAKRKNFSESIESIFFQETPSKDESAQGLSPRVLNKRPFKEYTTADKEQFIRYFAEFIKVALLCRFYPPNSPKRFIELLRLKVVINKLNHYEYLDGDKDSEEWILKGFTKPREDVEFISVIDSLWPSVGSKWFE